MTGAVRGAGDLARGARFLLVHPRLWIWVVAPAVVTLLLIVLAILGVLTLVAPILAWIAVLVPDFLEAWVGGLFRVLVVAGLSVAGVLVYVSATGALAGPFCELLSEAMEERITGVAGPRFSLWTFVRGVLVGVAHAIRRLGIALGAAILIFALGMLIPVVGTAIAAAIAAYVAARAAAYDCYDAVFGRRLWRYRQKRGFLRAHRARTVGLGAAVAALLLVPVVNLVALGIGAAGATLAVLEIEREEPG